MSEEEMALQDVDVFGELRYPVGEDRARLCHAAKVLAQGVRRRDELLKELENIIINLKQSADIAWIATGTHPFSKDMEMDLDALLSRLLEGK
jgi:hypothetical protein